MSMISSSAVAKPQSNRGGNARIFACRTMNRHNGPSLVYNHQYRSNISSTLRHFVSGSKRVDGGIVCRSAAPTSGVRLLVFLMWKFGLFQNLKKKSGCRYRFKWCIVDSQRAGYTYGGRDHDQGHTIDL